jgi:flagellar biosynthesis/type III secretory pathway protein FliH
MLQQRVIEWTQQWKQEGLQAGLAEGRAEGLTKGRAEGRRHLLIQLVERRFGPLTPEQRERVEAADIEELADRLLEARSLDELLGR